MISHIWSVLCDRAIIDRESNNVTFTVIEEMKATIEISPGASQDNIMLPIKGQLVSLWIQDQKNPVPAVEYRVRVKNPKGTVIGLAGKTAPFGSSRRIRTITSFDRFPISPNGNGNYWFLIDQKTKSRWKSVARVPLWVEVEIIEKSAKSPA